MLPLHLALVSETSSVDASEVTRVAAALQKQVLRDFGPSWRIIASVDAVARLEDVPLGYWPMIVLDDGHPAGIEGIHLDEQGQPFALIQAGDSWSLTASHECLEMLADPYGNRLQPGRSNQPGQGRVEYLVEVCDPCEAIDFAYTVNGVTVSDFYTPNYLDPVARPGVRYSFTGAITKPREVLSGGYLSWRDPKSGHWWQQVFFGAHPQFVDLGVLAAGGESLRTIIDGRTPFEDLAPELVGLLPEDDERLVAARRISEEAAESTKSRAESWRRQIELLKRDKGRASLEEDRVPARESTGGEVTSRRARPWAGLTSDADADADVDADTYAELFASGPGANPSNRDPKKKPNKEQARLTRKLPGATDPVAKQILVASGYDKLVAGFETAFYGATNLAQARAAVERCGLDLWNTATKPAQDPQDDRPLYWARLSMALLIRQWKPPFKVTPAQMTQLAKRLELTTRGMSSINFGSQGRKMLVSGFDPFDLNGNEPHGANTSGAAALALDGRILHATGGDVEIQAVIFPVRYVDFDNGLVEEIFRPHLLGSAKVDLFTTVSVHGGSKNRFELEVWNGRNRSSQFRDNLDMTSGGTLAAPVEPKGLQPGPQFAEHGLPHARMVTASDANFIVVPDETVVEIPAGQTHYVPRWNGPTPGSRAVEGSGGGFLSNEIAYRTTRMRLKDMPGGHVHTPDLNKKLPPDKITDPVFETFRKDVVYKTIEIIKLAAGQ